jgi:hypothetical protein
VRVAAHVDDDQYVLALVAAEIGKDVIVVFVKRDVLPFQKRGVRLTERDDLLIPVEDGVGIALTVRENSQPRSY